MFCFPKFYLIIIVTDFIQAAIQLSISYDVSVR